MVGFSNLPHAKQNKAYVFKHLQHDHGLEDPKLQMYSPVINIDPSCSDAQPMSRASLATCPGQVQASRYQVARGVWGISQEEMRLPAKLAAMPEERLLVHERYHQRRSATGPARKHSHVHVQLWGRRASSIRSDSDRIPFRTAFLQTRSGFLRVASKLRGETSSQTTQPNLVRRLW